MKGIEMTDITLVESKHNELHDAQVDDLFQQASQIS